MARSDGKHRKHPWVTYLVALGMLGSFGFPALSGAEARLAADEAIAAALEFFEANPQVEVDPRFAAIVGPERVERLRGEEEARREVSRVPSLRGRLASRTQKRYRRLEEGALASVEALPTWRLAVKGRESPGLNYLAHALLHDRTAALAVSLGFFLLAGLALETVWGSLLFAGLCVGGSAAAAAAHVAFCGGEGAPWIGASGLLSALMGAYFIRAFRGFVIPGWVVLPAWVALEYLVVRGFWIGSFELAPVQAHGVGFGLGATWALVLWLFGIEDRLRDRRGRTRELVANPIVDRALQARRDGRLDEALALLQREVARSPHNCDAAVAFWDVAVGMGRAQLAGSAMLRVVQDSLRQGQNDEAVRHWLALAGSLPALEVEAGVAVRLGELLLDAGHPDEAVRVLSSAMGASKGKLSSALASRVVRVARGLDPDLTRRAAAAALDDARLDPTERRQLQSILDERAPRPPAHADGGEGDETDSVLAGPESQPRASGPSPESPRPVPPEPGSLQDPHAISAEALAETQPVKDEAWEFDDYQDPHSLSAAALEAESPQPGPAPRAPASEIESWNSPGMLEDLSAELSDGEAEVETGLGARDREHADDGDEEDTETQFIMPAQLGDAGGSGVDSGSDAASMRPRGRGLRIGDDTAVEVCEQSRVLRVRSAVPLALAEAGISLDVSGDGKTSLPYTRINALSVAAVQGLQQRSVIVIDVVLNWIAPPDEPLRVLRLRSDEFSPRALIPDANSPIEGLRAILAEILDRSGAVPLPNVDAARGKSFATYADLTTYHRAVLGVDAA